MVAVKNFSLAPLAHFQNDGATSSKYERDRGGCSLKRIMAHRGIWGVTQACAGSAVTIRRNLSQTNMPSTDA